MSKTEVTWPAENSDDELDRQRQWFAENEHRAREALAAAGVWYGPRPPEGGARAPTSRVELALDAAASVTSIGREQLMAGGHAHVTAARHVIFFILRNHCRLSVSHIARSFGCHHGVVVNGCNRIAASRADFDSWIAPMLAKIGVEQP